MSSRTLGTVAVVAVIALLVGLFAMEVGHAVRGGGLPLGQASVIREQAAAKHLDPALIAAVIYTETKFDPRTSPAGAQGLMQILPATAYFIAHLSGGSRFNAADLDTPSVNVAYGSYYLRYLLDRYDGDELLALAAYNGGVANVDGWAARASAAGTRLTVDGIPFGETRAYVRRVLAAQRAYRALYPRALGLR
jgi:soluble lytic murein transglycosylase